MELQMIRTLPKCLWHLLLCGCHLPRVSGKVEDTLLLQQEQGALLGETSQMRLGQKQQPGRQEREGYPAVGEEWHALRGQAGWLC